MLNHSEWKRYGRGRDFQFFVTDEELYSVLATYLPEAYAPYRLFGVDVIKADREYRRASFSASILGLPELVHENRVNNMYWIGSSVITPRIRIDSGHLESDFAVNGLILLRHGAKRSVRTTGDKPKLFNMESSIGLVDKIRHNVTGEIQRHKEYADIFNRLNVLCRSF